MLQLLLCLLSLYKFMTDIPDHLSQQQPVGKNIIDDQDFHFLNMCFANPVKIIIKDCYPSSLNVFMISILNISTLDPSRLIIRSFLYSDSVRIKLSLVVPASSASSLLVNGKVKQVLL